MIIGVPREVKDHESRVGITPAGVKALTEAGHKVLVEKDAGALSSFPDDDYQAVGAEIVGAASDLWRTSDMIVKVKEPVPQEYFHFREGLVLFTYLHLAPLKELTDALLSKKVTGNVCIIGGGIVGTNAAKIAVGMGAKVTLLDLNLNRLRELDDIFNGKLFTLASNSYNIERAVCEADLLIGGVLIPGAAAPKIVTKAMVAKMKKGAVVVDVAIDQGGCIETAHPTTHSDPSYLVNGVVHYCVTNMPAAVPNTSTLALTNATFPYVMHLAKVGAKEAIRANAGIAEGVNTYDGHLTYKAVAEGQGREFTPIASLLER
jgi:alanine dehydrogenase